MTRLPVSPFALGPPVILHAHPLSRTAFQAACALDATRSDTSSPAAAQEKEADKVLPSLSFSLSLFLSGFRLFAAPADPDAGIRIYANDAALDLDAGEIRWLNEARMSLRSVSRSPLSYPTLRVPSPATLAAPCLLVQQAKSPRKTARSSSESRKSRRSCCRPMAPESASVGLSFALSLIPEPCRGYTFKATLLNTPQGCASGWKNSRPKMLSKPLSMFVPQ